MCGNATSPLTVVLTAVGICLCSAGCSPTSGNKPPDPPTLVCPDTVVVGARVGVHVSASDPEGDSVAIQLQWNDSVTGWFSYRASGETVVIYHTLKDTGTVHVKARAKDKKSASTWSAGLTIAVAPAGPVHPDSIYDTLPLVDEYVYSCAVSPTGDYLYVTYSSCESITPVRLADRTREPSFSVGDPGGPLVVSPDGRHLYMALHNDSFVDVIRASDHTLETRVPVGPGAEGLCITPDGQYVWVALYDQYRLAVIRTSDNTVTDTIGTFWPWGPINIGVSPGGDYAYVTCGHLGTVIARIGTAGKTIVDTVVVGVLAGTPVFSPDGQFLYSATQGDTGIVEVRTPDMKLTRIAPCGTPYINNLAVTPNGAYVVGATYYGLLYVDTRTFTAADTVLPKDWGYVGLHPTGDTLYLAQSRRLYVLGPKNR